ncbi:GDP-mannose 4,6-dehydratase [bacterium]|nr:GDP-mannose 4,6-dehydratase [bacterium]
MAGTKSRTVLITGISGQDGSYLCERLVERGERVVGLVARAQDRLPPYLEEYLGALPGREAVRLVSGDVTEAALFGALLSDVKPDWVFHLAAVSSVAQSFSAPLLAAEVNGVATMRLLEAVRLVAPEARVFLAISGEVFGPRTTPADETCDFSPGNPYAASKAFAYWSGVNFRESYDLFICNGIFFNHESPRRPPGFVTRKVVRGAVEIAAGKRQRLALGNLEPVRDWGYAPEYMDAAVRMLEADRPGDYVIATGEGHSVRELVSAVFEAVGLDYTRCVEEGAESLRPSDLAWMVGNPAKIERELGWKAETRFNRLVEILVQAELAAGGAAA